MSDNDVHACIILEECPSEIKYPNKIQNIDDVPLDVEKGSNICICGNLFYSFWVCKRLLSKGYTEISFKLSNTVEEQMKTQMLNKFCHVKFVYSESDEPFDQLILTTWQEAKKATGGYKVLDIYNLFEKIPEYYNPDIEIFKNSKCGETCFIVATDPRLYMEDLDLLQQKKITCFSMNGNFVAFDKTDWRPDFYVVSDPKAISAYQNEIIESNISEKFVADTFPDFWKDQREKTYGDITLYESV